MKCTRCGTDFEPPPSSLKKNDYRCQACRRASNKASAAKARARTSPPSAEIVERFWAKVDKSGPNGCWLWTASTRRGYGHFWWNGRLCLAHRVSWTLLRGEIPEGLTLDHLCRVHGCVNPDHLEPVTQKVNTLRGDTFPRRNSEKTHCAHGHRFTLENTRWTRVHGCTARVCRTCKREQTRRRDQKRRDARIAASRGGEQ